MIPRDVEILYEKKQLAFDPRAASSILSDCERLIVSGSIQCQVSEESALMEIQQKPIGSVVFDCRFSLDFFTGRFRLVNSTIVFSIQSTALIEHEIKEQNDKAPAVSLTAIYTFYGTRCLTIFRFDLVLER